MAINSVSASTSAVQQLQPKPQEVKPQRAAEDAAKPQEPPKRAEAPRESERSESKQEPRPVVNAQGQKTGTIINTSA